MERRWFGSTKREVSVIGQGTWYIEQANRATAIAALRRGVDLGMTHIDTAEMYGAGAAEELVGEAVAGRRDEIFLVSKVLPEHASRSGVVAACEMSLARLRTDRVDCYLLHWRGRHPLEDTIAGFDQLQREGKILSWGVSNFDAPDLDKVLMVAGKGHPACNQVLYHLGERAIEHAVIPWCEENDVAVVAYSPLGHRGGFPGPHTAGGRVLKAIADAHGATPRQVALRFLVRWPSLFVIPKASSPEHAVENAGAGELRLSDADLARIDEAFPFDHRPRGLPMI
ncbi:MAG: Aldo/keto reductase [Rhodospirillales bacterium]|nr:Aldo/keto reductase [Rhodospirillales bacterium]